MSHHYSGPNIGFPRGDARLDLTDLYAFPKPGDPGKSILIMNFHPSVGLNPPGPTTSEPFAPEARYELKIDTDGDAVANISYEVRFASVEGGEQTATLRRVEGAQAAETGAGGKVIVEGAPVSTGHEGHVTQAGDHRFFAGWRSDPFFFDVLGTINNFQFTTGDFFADKDICSIVLEVAQLSSWAERGWAVGSHVDSNRQRGWGLDPSGSRGAAQPNSLSFRRAERRVPRRGASGRCTFRSCLRARSGTYGRVFIGRSKAGGWKTAAGPFALRPQTSRILPGQRPRAQRRRF